MPFVIDKKTHDSSLHFGKLIGYGTFQLNQSFTRSLLLQEQIAIQKWKGFTLVCEVVMLANLEVQLLDWQLWLPWVAGGPKSLKATKRENPPTTSLESGNYRVRSNLTEDQIECKLCSTCSTKMSRLKINVC